MQDRLERNQKLSWEDRTRLPYLMASTLETLRKASFSSLNAPHRTIRDTRLSDYDIERNTTVFTNLWWIHNNPVTWERPGIFYPEHFLDTDGQVFTPKSFMPFSLGTRFCLGEKLAKMQMFLFLGRILQSFRLEPDMDGIAPPTEPSSNDTIRILGPYKISLVRDDLII
ncbi:steroid 17-alpha-hydroxylase/17,20 lyase-like [Apostichopus japonicus]|uniref:steroid 17-alpha-hydroxylase/17,20 lyase-like n=1 Tax=Stichopus japonicus TaxID=307972 RepID=UPI003AB88292